MKPQTTSAQHAPLTEASPLLNIDQYLRKRLMPAEKAIPHIPGIQMFGSSIPAETVGGDLFEYASFQQRYDIDARIQQAHRLTQVFVEPLPAGAAPRNLVNDQVQWLKTAPDYRPEMEKGYRFARSSEQMRVAEELRELYSTAGVLVVDAQGHLSPRRPTNRNWPNCKRTTPSCPPVSEKFWRSLSRVDSANKLLLSLAQVRSRSASIGGGSCARCKHIRWQI